MNIGTLALIALLALGACTGEDAEEAEPSEPPEAEITNFHVVSDLASTGDDVVDDGAIDGQPLPPMTTCRLTPLHGTLAIVTVESLGDTFRISGDGQVEQDHVCNPEDYGWPYDRLFYRETTLKTTTHIVGDSLPSTFTVKATSWPEVPEGGLLLTSVYELRGEYFVGRWGYEIDQGAGSAVHGPGDGRRIDFPLHVETLREDAEKIRNSPPAECPDGMSKTWAAQVLSNREKLWFGGQKLERACEDSNKDFTEGP